MYAHCNDIKLRHKACPQTMTDRKMMNKQGSEVSSVTVAKIAPPLHDKFFKSELMQGKMFHYFLLAHEKVNKVCRVFPFLGQPGTSY